MSQIFDALLKSRAEQDDPAAQRLAGELLCLVENQAPPQWESSALGESPDGAAATEGSVTGPEVDLPRPHPFEAREPLRRPWDAERSQIWNQFRSIPFTPDGEDRLVCLTGQAEPAAEAFRLLGVRLKHMRQIRPLNKLLITSTAPQEGKSTVAANLACTLAHITREKILLVEGDVRRPSLSRIFQLSNLAGMCEWLRGERGLAECIYRIEAAGIHVFPAGKAAAAPLELMQAKKLPVSMDQLAGLFSWIIVDSPPILPLADASIWTRIVDGILLVTRQGITEKKQLERALKALGPEKLIGALLNCSRVSTYSSYYYYKTAAAS